MAQTVGGESSRCSRTCSHPSSKAAPAGGGAGTQTAGAAAFLQQLHLNGGENQHSWAGGAAYSSAPPGGGGTQRGRRSTSRSTPQSPEVAVAARPAGGDWVSPGERSVSVGTQIVAMRRWPRTTSPHGQILRSSSVETFRAFLLLLLSTSVRAHQQRPPPCRLPFHPERRKGPD